MLPLAKKLYNKGFGIYATKGTATLLRNNGIEAKVVEKIWEGAESIPNLLQTRKNQLYNKYSNKGKRSK